MLVDADDKRPEGTSHGICPTCESAFLNRKPKNKETVMMRLLIAFAVVCLVGIGAIGNGCVPLLHPEVAR